MREGTLEWWTSLLEVTQPDRAGAWVRALLSGCLQDLCTSPHTELPLPNHPYLCDGTFYSMLVSLEGKKFRVLEMRLFLQGSACVCIRAHLCVCVRVYVCVCMHVFSCVCSPPAFSLLVSCLPLPTLPKFHYQRGCVLNLINYCPLRPPGAVLYLVWRFVTPWTGAYQAPLSMGILQARILEWVTYPFWGSSQPRN